MSRSFHDTGLRAFGFSALLTVVVVVMMAALAGASAAATTLVLVAIEIAFSFDNAVVNAKTLGLLSPFWQRMFLSVGMIVAVLGMRVIFPIAIVSLTAHLGWGQVFGLAVHHPEQYAARLAAAHTAIAAFGGAFLLMLALDFFLDEDRTVLWLVRWERLLQRAARVWLPLVLTTAALAVASLIPANHEPKRTFVAGVLGLATYELVQLLTKLFSATQTAGGVRTGFAAFTTFVYLEVLDASFSFDGVLGAFAVTSKVLLIAAGLGVGAFWVRSLSVFMVRRGTLKAYRYLEHGAHYTILILAALLLVSVVANVPDVIAGLAGLGFIGASVIASRQAMNGR